MIAAEEGKTDLKLGKLRKKPTRKQVNGAGQCAASLALSPHACAACAPIKTYKQERPRSFLPLLIVLK